MSYPDLAVKVILAKDRRTPRFSALPWVARFSFLDAMIPAALPPRSSSADEIVAVHVSSDFELGAAYPSSVWRSAYPITFCADWRGQNPDQGRETTVRVVWSWQNLYLRFECRYRELFLFDNADPNGRRDHLWDRDVAEAFLQPDPAREREYREFEVSPNGMWIDLAISPGGLADLKSGLRRSVHLDENARRWSVELAVPTKALTSEFDPRVVWRANFYRIEGRKEPRAYLAWRPTGTPQPNFHVPSAFGVLRFAPPAGS